MLVRQLLTIPLNAKNVVTQRPNFFLISIDQFPKLKIIRNFFKIFNIFIHWLNRELVRHMLMNWTDNGNLGSDSRKNLTKSLLLQSDIIKIEDQEHWFQSEVCSLWLTYPTFQLNMLMHAQHLRKGYTYQYTLTSAFKKHKTRSKPCLVYEYSYIEQPCKAPKSLML